MSSYKENKINGLAVGKGLTDEFTGVFFSRPSVANKPLDHLPTQHPVATNEDNCAKALQKIKQQRKEDALKAKAESAQKAKCSF